MKAGIQNDVIPFRTTSIVGFRTITKLHKKGKLSTLPQVVYLDSAHEGGETHLELRIAWCMLPPEGGVIMGDDYSKYWPGLVEDIAKFATYLDKMSDKVARQNS